MGESIELLLLIVGFLISHTRRVRKSLYRTQKDLDSHRIRFFLFFFFVRGGTSRGKRYFSIFPFP